MIGNNLRLILCIATIVSGCAWTVPQPVLVREPKPDIIPVQVGVHYPPELRDYRYRHHFTDTAYVLGTPSVRLLHEAFGLLFTDVVELPSREAKPAGGNAVAAIIEPRITSAGFTYPTPGTRYFPTHVTYGFTLYSPDGAPIASWTVTGRGDETFGNPLDAVNTVRRSFEQAMREAAWKLTSEFRTVPEVQAWLDARALEVDRRRVPP